MREGGRGRGRERERERETETESTKIASVTCKLRQLLDIYLYLICLCMRLEHKDKEKKEKMYEGQWALSPLFCVRQWLVPFVQEVVTPFYIVTYYIKWGNYFLDTRYV